MLRGSVWRTRQSGEPLECPPSRTSRSGLCVVGVPERSDELRPGGEASIVDEDEELPVEIGHGLPGEMETTGREIGEGLRGSRTIRRRKPARSPTGTGIPGLVTRRAWSHRWTTHAALPLRPSREPTASLAVGEPGVSTSSGALP
jgi:hypothetical protein